jgi:hypothetical protein
MAPGMRRVLPSAEYEHVAAANYISRPKWAAASVGATSPQLWPRYFVLSAKSRFTSTAMVSFARPASAKASL